MTFQNDRHLRVRGCVELLLQILTHFHYGKLLSLVPLKVLVKVPVDFVCSTKEIPVTSQILKKKVHKNDSTF